jgi:hypothetical protein
MSWNYRRSARLPGGFRMNFSKRGIGYSWGFRGFRIGKDSSGRITRTLSIPGTGLYERTVLKPVNRDEPAQGQTKPRNTQYVGGSIVLLCCLVALSLAHPLFWIVTGTTLIVMVSCRLRSKSRNLQSGPGDLQSQPSVANPAAGSLGRTLSHEAIEMRDLLNRPIRSEWAVLGSGSATDYDDMFCIEIFHLVCRFGYNGGPGTLQAGQFFVDIMVPLQPRTYEGIVAEDALNMMKTHAEVAGAEANSTSYLLDQALRADRHNHTASAGQLVALMTQIAQAAAACCGLVPELQQKLVEWQTSISVQVRGSQLLASTERSPDQPGSHPVPATSSGTSEGHVNVEHPRHQPENLGCSVKRWMDESLPLFKAEMRRLRGATNCQEIMEADLREVLLHFGVVNGQVTQQSACSYREVFMSLHPRKYGGSTIESVSKEMIALFTSGVRNYSAPLTVPFTFKMLNESSLDVGKVLASATAEIFVAIAEASGASTSDIVQYKALIGN